MYFINDSCIFSTGRTLIISVLQSHSIIKINQKIFPYFYNLLFKFNKEVKHPPINQIFKVIIIEYESKKYCADILFTDANWNEDTKFEEISKENCGKDHLNSNWDYKNYIKDYKIMGELFKNKLEFLEWYIGFELIDLLQNAGFDNIKKLGTI
uniref:Uncharacterized protein n=1 Tax=Meloidogyne enterolobii TaxID=390850 RepID=A0A6V7X5S9_MELEN|nr:unnamed protein product [Meloidogyne enterolobii]